MIRPMSPHSCKSNHLSFIESHCSWKKIRPSQTKVRIVCLKILRERQIRRDPWIQIELYLLHFGLARVSAFASLNPSHKIFGLPAARRSQTAVHSHRFGWQVPSSPIRPKRGLLSMLPPTQSSWIPDNILPTAGIEDDSVELSRTKTPVAHH